MMILVFLKMGVDAQQSKFLTESYLIVTGYDVSNYSTPVSTTVTVLSGQVASYACMYACNMVAVNCAFSVLKADLTCSVYNSSARTSVYASANSSLYRRQVNG
jgi:hypothetical protein